MKRNSLFTLIVLYHCLAGSKVLASIALVVNTWNFIQATEEAWKILQNGDTAVNALVAGCSKCEELQCDGTVGYGGSPDENGESTLDALIFDGSTMDMGAVAGLRRIKNAISVAKHVLENTKHSILVGSLATKFAVRMGFTEGSLSTKKSTAMYKQWLSKQCQPNFWKNVKPDPHLSCGPYQPVNELFLLNQVTFYKRHYDTIGMITIDSDGNIAAGTSSNGANHKIPGRVGDSPLVGAGAYADTSVGAAVATGDGDVMMRFLPSFLAVEELRKGETPTVAAQIAVNRIRSKYPGFFGAIVVVNAQGEYGAACNGMKTFQYCVKSFQFDKVKVEKKVCNE